MVKSHKKWHFGNTGTCEDWIASTTTTAAAAADAVVKVE